MLEFAFPLALLVLPAPLIVYWLLPRHRERTGALRVPFFGDLIKAAGLKARSGAVVLRRRRLQVIAMALVWLLLIAGLARPEWVGEPIVRSSAARDVMLAIDVSGSMDYSDFRDEGGNPVQRLAAVQEVVDQFVADRKDDRIGLIVFGDRAFLQLPFTRDLTTASALVNLISVGMAGPRTAIGDAIGLSIRSFESSEVDERLLILLTDGNDTASNMTPINAAAIAQTNGVTIYTIGVGDPNARGEDKVDFAALQAISDRTGGQFFEARDQQALADVYERIDDMQPGDVRTQSWRPRESLVHYPLGAALLVGFLGFGIMLPGAASRSAA